MSWSIKVDTNIVDPFSSVASPPGLSALNVKASNGFAYDISEAKAVDSVLMEAPDSGLCFERISSNLDSSSTREDNLPPAALDRCERSVKGL